MATWSDDFNGTRPVDLEVEVKLVSQDVAANTSTVQRIIRLKKTGTWDGPWNLNSDACAYSFTVNGSTQSGNKPYDFRGKSPGATITVKSSTLVVPHNADGTKTISVSATATDTVLGTATITTKTMTLPTIPRATVPVLSATTIEAGDDLTIELEPASEDFTHSLKYSFGSAAGTIATGVGEEYEWTVPLSLLNQIPASTAGTLTLIVETYNGAALIGSSSTPVTVLAGSTIVPTIASVSHAEATLDAYTHVGKYVQGISKLDVAIVGAAGAYGSTIVSSKIEIAGQTIQAASGQTGVITLSGTLELKGTVVDSRGRVGTKTASVSVLAYAPPQVTAFTLLRVDAGGTPDVNGDYVRITLKATCSSLVNTTEKNSITWAVVSRERGDTDWEDAADDTAALSVDTTEVVSTYDPLKIYEFQLQLSDVFHTAVVTRVLSAGGVSLEIVEKGIGVGKPWEEGSVDAAAPMYQEGHRVADERDLAPLAPTLQVAALLNALIPIGSLQDFAGDTVPDFSSLGVVWLETDGSLLDIDDYPELFNVIGTLWGGDGVTTFRLPPAGRVNHGRAAGDLEFGTVGATGGAKLGTMPLGESGSAMINWLIDSGTLAFRGRMREYSGSQTANYRRALAGSPTSPTTGNIGQGPVLEGTTEPGSLLQPYAVVTRMIRAK